MISLLASVEYFHTLKLILHLPQSSQYLQAAAAARYVFDEIKYYSIVHFRTNGGASRETPDRMSFLPASSHGCHMFGVVRTGAAASMRRGGGVARRGTRRGSRRGSRHGTRRGTRRAAGEWRTCMPECRSALYGGAHGKPVPVPQNAAYAAPRRAALLAPHTYDLSLSLSNAGSLHHTRDDS